VNFCTLKNCHTAGAAIKVKNWSIHLKKQKKKPKMFIIVMSLYVLLLCLFAIFDFNTAMNIRHHKFCPDIELLIIIKPFPHYKY